VSGRLRPVGVLKALLARRPPPWHPRGVAQVLDNKAAHPVGRDAKQRRKEDDDGSHGLGSARQHRCAGRVRGRARFCFNRLEGNGHHVGLVCIV